MNHFPLSCVRAAISLLVALGACCESGCAGGTKAKLHGKVALDGQPIATGSISFVPVDGKGRTTDAAIQDGQYTAEVPLGSQRVEIRARKVVGTRKLYDTPDSPTREVFEETIPAQFNSRSKLTQDVKPGDHQVDFELKSNG